MSLPPKPIALIILDGWGHSIETNANAIAAAHTPHWDRLWAERPHSLISASGTDVGLPADQMGNSEVGHMVMGAGRVLYQSYSRINNALEDKSFFKNTAICAAVDKCVRKNKAVHIFGLLSPGGVHSHEKHIHAMIKMAAERGAERIYLHAFLDGRDTPPRSALASLQQVESLFEELGRGQIASIVGRYHAMDRDNRWERIGRAYNMLTSGKADFTSENAVAGLEAAYARGEDDEFVQPTLVQGTGNQSASLTDGDSVIFMNFRADRARQLTRAFVDPEFNGFERKLRPKLSDFVTLTEYASDIDASCAYPPRVLHNVLGEYVESLGKTQLRIAETEKYAHVTFFFSGGRESEFVGEERILVPSPQVATYDLKPEMSAPEITQHLVAAISEQRHDLIICNFANGDMVGHTGKFDAAVKAVETVDICLGQIVKSLRQVGGECIITADHGNAEKMNDDVTGQPHTAHTTELVPFIYVNQRDSMIENREGSLADIAPTLLYLMSLEQPEEMTGESLVRFL